MSCPVFRPTLEEFEDFRKFIASIQHIAEPVGLCKVIPPAEWIRKNKVDVDNLDFKIPSPLKQCLSGTKGVYRVDLVESKSIALSDFRSMANKKQTPKEDIERVFWKGLGSIMDPPLYGADTPGSLFDLKERSSGTWNIDRLDTLLQLLTVGGDLPGVTRSMLYFGMWRALFAWHTEDLNLCSINYIHYGAPKSWYSVPPSSGTQFERLAQAYFGEEFRKCPEYLRHKTALLSPMKLKEGKIPYTTCTQSESEFMITWPGSYHAGFNHGFNIAESSNFGIESWLNTALTAGICRCRPYSVRIDIGSIAHMYWSNIAKNGKDVSFIDMFKKKESLPELDNGKIDAASLALLSIKDIDEEKWTTSSAALSSEEASKIRAQSAKSGIPWSFCCLCGFSDCSGDDYNRVEMDIHQDMTNRSLRASKRARIGPKQNYWGGEDIEGVQFQCTRCGIWCHAMCVYNNETRISKNPMCGPCLYATKKLDINLSSSRQKPNLRIGGSVYVLVGPYATLKALILQIEDGYVLVHYKGGRRCKENEWLFCKSKRLLTWAQSVELEKQAYAQRDKVSKPKKFAYGGKEKTFPRMLKESNLVTKEWIEILNSSCNTSTEIDKLELYRDRKQFVKALIEAKDIAQDQFILGILDAILGICAYSKDRTDSWNYAKECCFMLFNTVASVLNLNCSVTASDTVKESKVAVHIPEKKVHPSDLTAHKSKFKGLKSKSTVHKSKLTVHKPKLTVAESNHTVPEPKPMLNERKYPEVCTNILDINGQFSGFGLVNKHEKWLDHMEKSRLSTKKMKVGRQKPIDGCNIEPDLSNIFEYVHCMAHMKHMLAKLKQWKNDV